MISNGVLKVASVIAQGGDVEQKSSKATYAFTSFSEFFNKCSTTDNSWSQDNEFWEQPDVIAALDECIACAQLANDLAFEEDSYKDKDQQPENSHVEDISESTHTVTPYHTTVTPAYHPILTPPCLPIVTPNAAAITSNPQDDGEDIDER